MKDRRCGFTIVELMVVIAVIGILISMLLPAVQDARESARRLQCKNNTKQLALAIINYEGAKKRYPPGGMAGIRPSPTLADGPFDPRGGKMISWIISILPYMEENSLYKQFNLERSVLDQEANPQETFFNSLSCPSDDTRGRYFFDETLTSNKRFAKGNYAAFVSPFHIDQCDWLPGGLAGNRPLLRKHISDGTSKTMVVSEVRTRDDVRDQRGAWALPWAGSSLLAFDIHAVGTINSGGSYQPAAYSLGTSQLPNNQGINVDILYKCADVSGSQLDRMPCAEYSTDPGTVNHFLSSAPRSLHPGGVNVAFLDGHCGFLPNTVDEFSMAFLICPNDGRTIDAAALAP